MRLKTVIIAMALVGGVAYANSDIGGFVWNDENGNGIQDPGEVGIKDVKVIVRGDIKKNTKTDSQGKYRFTNLKSGKYYIRFYRPKEFEKASPKDVGKNDRIDSDGDINSSKNYNSIPKFKLSSNKNLLHKDMGYIKNKGGTTPPKTENGGLVWYDTNGNGIQDAGEKGANHKVVRLYSSKGKKIATTRTDVKGKYLFDNIADGRYYIKFTIPSKYNPSPVNQGGDDSKDSDGVGNNTKYAKTATFTMKNSKVDMDMGLIRKGTTGGGTTTPPKTNGKLTTVSTFHNLSVYWDNKKNVGEVRLQYKKKNETDWKEAQPLIYNQVTSIDDWKDKKTNKISNETKLKAYYVLAGTIISKANYRGSIVNLTPNTTYDIKLTLKNGETKTTRVKTWVQTDKLKIKKSYSANKGCDNYQKNRTCNITQSGSKNEGYIVIDGLRNNKKKLLDVKKLDEYNINIEGKSYIIIRNFKLRGATNSAIRLKSSHHIIIEDCEIRDWGSKDINYAKDQQSGILSEENLAHSVIQRNKIYNPFFSANSWSEKSDTQSNHPRGAQAITLRYNITGNNVIRYNEFHSSKGKYFNDVIGGNKNSGAYGFPGADSDIYGNYVANAMDDGIEVEGGGQNVRVWNNYIEKTFSAIANACTTVGPLYIWRNVSGEAAEINGTESSEKRDYGQFLKMGIGGKSVRKNHNDLMQGYIYVYNNTILNTNQKGYGGLGTTYDVKKKKSNNRVMRNITTRNNILHVRDGVNSISKQGKNSTKKHKNVDYGYDMVNSLDQVPKTYAKNHIDKFGDRHIIINNNPVYTISKPYLNKSKNGDFSLLTDYSQDTLCILNIIPYRHPDLGAQEGSKKMHFGIDAPYFTPPKYQKCPSKKK